MTDLLSLSLAELENYIVSIGEPKFRAKQIFGWLMKGRDLDGLNNVPRALTEKLKGDAFVSSVKLEEKRVSSDGTQKFLPAPTLRIIRRGVPVSASKKAPQTRPSWCTLSTAPALQ